MSISPVVLAITTGVCAQTPDEAPLGPCAVFERDADLALASDDVAAARALLLRYPGTPAMESPLQTLAGTWSTREEKVVLALVSREVCAPAARSVLAKRTLAAGAPPSFSRLLLRQSKREYVSGATTLVNLVAQTELLEAMISAGHVRVSGEIESLLRDVERLVEQSARRRSREKSQVAELLEELQQVEALWRTYDRIAGDLIVYEGRRGRSR